MSEMRVRILLLLFALAGSLQDPSTNAATMAEIPGVLAQGIPPRSRSAMTGSEFATFVSSVDRSMREQAILNELESGNMPAFLRRLKPVTLQHTLEGGRVVAVTIFVTPDYLAIGSDDDFLRIPMALPTAVEVAGRFGFVLPTTKMVDAIFEQSEFRLSPEPMPAGPQMRTTAYFWEHNRLIDRQCAACGFQTGALVSGHKKDLVLSDRLNRCTRRVAIYGWHRGTGAPIQPLSTVHGAEYADYSHGIRLVSNTVLLDGKPCSIYSILGNDTLASLLSDEGVIHGAQRLMTAFPPTQSKDRGSNALLTLMPRPSAGK
jgi:hypothetical protein